MLRQPEYYLLISLTLIISALKKKCWGKKAFLNFQRIMNATALGSENLPSTDFARLLSDCFFDRIAELLD